MTDSSNFFVSKIFMRGRKGNFTYSTITLVLLILQFWYFHENTFMPKYLHKYQYYMKLLTWYQAFDSNLIIYHYVLSRKNDLKA